MTQAKKLSRNDFIEIAGAHFKREHGKYFTLSYGSLPSARERGKFSCVVSKKVSNKASDRNLIKRRCRESVREALKKANFRGAAVFYAKKDVNGAAFQDIKSDIESLVAKIPRF